MRTCANCFNGHYNLDDNGESLYCDESDFMEEEVKEEDTCDSHRYIPGLEEEKNFLYYDESYIAPGYFIVNIKNNKLNKFIKIYNGSENGFPYFGIRAFSFDAKENLNEEFSHIDFTFRDIEDDSNGLFNPFEVLCNDLRGKSIRSIDLMRHGNNHFKLDTNQKVVTMIVSKDIYNGSQHPSDYYDVLIGDDYTCEEYESILKFYQSLSKVCANKMTSDDVKKLLLLQ